MFEIASEILMGKKKKSLVFSFFSFFFPVFNQIIRKREIVYLFAYLLNNIHYSFSLSF